MFGRKMVASYVAEFFGVLILTTVVYSMILKTPIPFFLPFFSSIAVGLTIAVLTLILGGISGAHLNPAVTLSMWVMRRIDAVRAVLYIAAQVLGAVAAFYLLGYLLDNKLQNIAGTKFQWRVLVAEALGAAIFLFGAVAAVVQDFTFVQKAAITGASFAVGIMAASIASNGILNPAVALGIQSWNLAYAIGPFVGAIIGSNVYAILYGAYSTKTKSKRK